MTPRYTVNLHTFSGLRCAAALRRMCGVGTPQRSAGQSTSRGSFAVCVCVHGSYDVASLNICVRLFETFCRHFNR